MATFAVSVRFAVACLLFLFATAVVGRSVRIVREGGTAKAKELPFTVLSSEEPYINYTLLHGWLPWHRWSNPAHMLELHLTGLAEEQLVARRNSVIGLHSQEDWEGRQAWVKSRLSELWSGFPDRTPLNPVITGNLTRPGFRVEKLYFESRPERYVTAALFLPDGVKADGHNPAVLFASGHAQDGFRHDAYQSALLNLVTKGFIVLAFDPVGQGERLEYTLHILPDDPVREHQVFGRQCLMNGVNSGEIFLWDAMRALDYLLLRPEVDPGRIGMCGNSGGGTQTSYMMATDDRILAASPGGYIVGFFRLITSTGLQDAEQIWWRGLGSLGPLDHADLIEVRAPKPTLVICTTDDQIFSIQGTRETVNEAHAAFQAFGNETCLDHHEANDMHGYDTPNREAIYAFFQKYLDLPGNSTEMPIQQFSDEELRVTDLGQVLYSIPGALRTFDFIKGDATANMAAVEARRQANVDQFLDNVPLWASNITGLLYPASPRARTTIDVFPMFMGTLPLFASSEKPDYGVHKFLLAGEGELVLPLLVFLPQGATKEQPVESLLYLHPDGKNNLNTWVGGFVEDIVHKGYAVAVPDLSGLGEVGDAFEAAPGDNVGYAGSRVPYLAAMLGRSVVGIHVADILRVAAFVLQQDEISGIAGSIAHDKLTQSLTHAAALTTELDLEGHWHGRDVSSSVLGRIFLLRPMLSYSASLMHLTYGSEPMQEVANVIPWYDLQDLIACRAPLSIDVIAPTDHSLLAADQPLVDQEYVFAKGVYEDVGAADKLRVVVGALNDDEMFAAVLGQI